MKIKLLSYTPSPEEVVANAARLCYSSMDIDSLFDKYTDEQNKNMIDKLINMHHDSPTEHVSFTFGVEGVSRSLLAQLTRHRIGSYSVKSQRYVRENQFEYIVPHSIKNIPKAKETFIKTMENDQKVYDELVDLLILEQIKDFWRCEGVHENKLIEYEDDLIDDFKERYPNSYKTMEKKAIEDARYVFPNACETKIIMTMNARSLMNFFELRCCNRAQQEIRELADKMLIECKKIAPNLFKYAGASCMFGNCPEGSKSCGSPRRIEEYQKEVE